jgi:hypothetical protein
MGNTYIKYVHPLKAAAVTALTRASPGTIVIPAGHTGRLKRIIVTVWPTLETIVDAGGFVEIENDAIKGTQISFVTPNLTAVTLGGGDNLNYEIDCDLPLVGPSTYTVWYTPNDNQSQTLSIGLEWEVGAQADASRPNYIKGHLPLFSAVVSAITIAVAHNTIAIPSGKSGRLLRVEFSSYGTGTTVVDPGGFCELKSTVDDWKPFEFVSSGITVVGAGGGGFIANKRFTVNKVITGNASVTNDFTPYNATAQIMGLTIFWRGPEPS